MKTNPWRTIPLLVVLVLVTAFLLVLVTATDSWPKVGFIGVVTVIVFAICRLCEWYERKMHDWDRRHGE